MRRVLSRAVTGTPGIFFIGSAAVIGLSALAWGLWGHGADIRPTGLMAIDAPPAHAAQGAHTAQPTPSSEPDAAPEASPQVEVPTHVESANDPVTFDGRPLRPVERMDMKVTAYSPDERSCGEWADGWTASGYSVWTNGMKLVAADISRLPFGTIVSIPGYNNGEPVQVLDIGGAIKGNRLDVLYPTHERALQWGVQHLEVTVWEYAD